MLPTIFFSNLWMVPLWRKVAIARRNPLASSEVNFAASMAMRIACSWNSGTPSVRRRMFFNSSLSPPFG